VLQGSALIRLNCLSATQLAATPLLSSLTIQSSHAPFLLAYVLYDAPFYLTLFCRRKRSIIGLAAGIPLGLILK
jgi:hypothetical protein